MKNVHVNIDFDALHRKYPDIKPRYRKTNKPRSTPPTPELIAGQTTTKALKAGDVIWVKVGCKQLDDVTWKQACVVGTYGNKRIEVSFSSGLVCRFNAETKHNLASDPTGFVIQQVIPELQ